MPTIYLYNLCLTPTLWIWKWNFIYYWCVKWQTNGQIDFNEISCPVKTFVVKNIGYFFTGNTLKFISMSWSSLNNKIGARSLNGHPPTHIKKIPNLVFSKQILPIDQNICYLLEISCLELNVLCIIHWEISYEEMK